MLIRGGPWLGWWSGLSLIMPRRRGRGGKSLLSAALSNFLNVSRVGPRPFRRLAAVYSGVRGSREFLSARTARSFCPALCWI